MKHFFVNFYKPGLLIAGCALAWQAQAQQACDPNLALTRPNTRYELVAGSTPAGSEVKDKVTGLIWQRCMRGMSWSGTTCTGSNSSHTWTQALVQARTATATTATPATAWRLPSRNELLSLAEIACRNPAINATWFPNQPTTYPGYYAWSASSFSGNPDFAWFVDFGYGVGYRSYKSYAYAVRLVRSGR